MNNKIKSPIVVGTPLQWEHNSGLLVKREDLSCPHPGPPFSKMRGVFAHVKKRFDEGVRVFGALDTSHSQAGHAVATACAALGAKCITFYPVRKAHIWGDASIEGIEGWRFRGLIPQPEYLGDPQTRAHELGADLWGLPAGRSAILYHQAKKLTVELGGYMMPNALKLEEMVEETAAEVVKTFEMADREQYDYMRSNPWLISISSGTIAAGVAKGLEQMFREPPPIIAHMGYERSRDAVRKYIYQVGGLSQTKLSLISERYGYSDPARDGPTPSWPCNKFYDLKAYRWWMANRREDQRATLWNIG